MLNKQRVHDNVKALEESINKCDFRGTAKTYSRTLSELMEAHTNDIIEYEEYGQLLDKAMKLLNDNKCSCTKMK